MLIAPFLMLRGAGPDLWINKALHSFSGGPITRKAWNNARKESGSTHFAMGTVHKIYIVIQSSWSWAFLKSGFFLWIIKKCLNRSNVLSQSHVFILTNIFRDNAPKIMFCFSPEYIKTQESVSTSSWKNLVGRGNMDHTFTLWKFPILFRGWRETNAPPQHDWKKFV
jgi:hypothetical protein